MEYMDVFRILLTAVFTKLPTLKGWLVTYAKRHCFIHAGNM
jgi:hypothetical protein